MNYTLSGDDVLLLRRRGSDACDTLISKLYTWLSIAEMHKGTGYDVVYSQFIAVTERLAFMVAMYLRSTPQANDSDTIRRCVSWLRSAYNGQLQVDIMMSICNREIRQARHTHKLKTMALDVIMLSIDAINETR